MKDRIHTHLAWVRTGPYSTKYCGMESPINIENPRINFPLKLFKLQN